MTIRKLPAKAASFVLPFIISIMMSCLVSGISTYHSIAPGTDFVSVWMSAWGFSWVIAFPVLLIVLPTARKIMYFFVEKPEGA